MLGSGPFKAWRTRLLCWLTLTLMAWGTLGRLAFAADLPSRAGRVSDLLQDTFTSANGLPQSTVEALTRTRDGYLWLGTQDGLARFDGMRFKVFNRQNTEGLAQSHIRALNGAHDGTLWIGTQGSGVVHAVDGKFIPYSVREGLLNPFVRCILEGSNGTVWFGTMGGLARWHEGKFDGFTVSDGLADNNVQAIAEDLQGRLWVGTGLGLSLLDHGKFVAIPGQELFAGQPVAALAVDKDGAVWAGGNRKLVRFLAGRAITWSTPATTAAPPFIQKLAIDSTGALWVGTDSQGLYRLRAGIWERYGTQEGLSDADILALLPDSEGILWVGTNAGGLNRLRKRLITMIGAPEGLSDTNATAVIEDRDGSLWIATPGHGLDHLRDGAIRTYTTRDGLGSDVVYSLWQSPRDGKIWAGTNDGSLQWLEGQKFHRFALPNHGSVARIMEDSAGNMWLGTRRGLVQIRDGRVVRTYTKDDGLPNSTVFAVTEARDGSLWLGTIDGLSHFVHGTFTNFSPSKAGGSLLTSVEAGPGGAVWFTGGDGFGRWQDGKLSLATARNGLVDDDPYAMVEDGAGNLWISSNHGIQRTTLRDVNNLFAGNTDSLRVRVFDTADGLRNNECYGGTQPASWKRRNGDILFACIGGVVEFNPARLALPAGEPPVHLEEVRINHKEIRPEDLHRTLRIAPGSGNLEFTYTGIDFVAPRQMHFWYRLENFDKDWVEAGTRRSAYYTNIPPGTYRFEVIAENADGVKSSTSASLAFTLGPHFYQTVPFYCISALFLLALVFACDRLRVRRMHAHKRQLQKLVDERTAALRSEVAEHRRAEVDLQAARHAAEEARAEAEYRATHDFLSGIYNRAAIINLLDRETERSHREGQPLSVLLIDADHFKTVNDTHGHLVGDQVIKLLTEKMSSVLRPYDSLGRFGGEEFLILLPNCATGEAMEVAERLRSAIAGGTLLPGEFAILVTLSIGLSTITNSSQTTTWVLRAADAALYAAKRNGRNRVECCAPLKDVA